MQRNGPQSHILVDYIILTYKFMLTSLKIAYAIFVEDIIWNLLGSYSDITSVDGDEEIEWQFENNKPVLKILLVCSF